MKGKPSPKPLEGAAEDPRATSIRAQLTASFLSIVLFILLVALAGYLGIDTLSRGLGEIQSSNSRLNSLQQLAGLAERVQQGGRDLIDDHGQSGLRALEELRELAGREEVLSRRNLPAEQQVLLYLLKGSLEDYLRGFSLDFLPLWEERGRLLSTEVGLALSNAEGGEAAGSRARLADLEARLGLALQGLDRRRQQLELAAGKLGELLEARIASSLEASERYAWRIRALMLVASLLALAWSLAIALLYSRRLSRAIRQVFASMQEISAGRLTATMNASYRDEIGALGAHCNQFLAKLSGIIGGIRNSVAASLGQSRRLLGAMAGVGASAEEIGALAGEVESVIERQSGIIEEVSANVEEIVRTIEQQDAKVGRQAEAIRGGTGSVELLIGGVRDIDAKLDASAGEFARLLRVTEEGRGNIGRLKDIVQALDEQSDSVISANDIVKSIAAQTNLLSMNAAIEAAHAGDSGRGFAVVADEIRKLAEVSNRQSKFISEKLSGLKRSIEEVVAMSDTTGASFEIVSAQVRSASSIQEEIRAEVGGQAEKSGRTLEALGGIGQVTEEVREGSREILESSHAVIREISSLVSISRQVEEAARGVAGAVAQVRENASRASELLDSSQATTRRLAEQVAFFVIDEACLPAEEEAEAASPAAS